MSLVRELGQKLGDIVEADGPAALAESALNEAIIQLYVARRDLINMTSGLEHELPKEMQEPLDAALDKATEARALMASAIGSIAAVQGSIFGGGTSAASTSPPISSRVESTLRAQTQSPSPLVSERAKRPPVHALYRRIENDAYTPCFPNQKIRDLAETAQHEQLEQLERFYDFLEHTPNNNEKYDAELDAIHTYLTQEGLPHVPVLVLPEEQFAQAHDILFPSESIEQVSGFERGGVAIIRDKPKTLNARVFGSVLVIGTALHEIGHAIGHVDDLFVTANSYEEGARAFLQMGGFGKYNLMTQLSAGNFLEEADADLLRVEGLTALGKAAHLTERKEFSGGIVFVPAHQTPELPSHGQPTIEIPAQYLDAAAYRADRVPIASFSSAAIAAYGLQLLYNEVPGLQDAMKASRTNPAKQAHAIKLINSVQPGLYPRLRELRYDESQFSLGLRVIGQAIRDNG